LKLGLSAGGRVCAGRNEFRGGGLGRGMLTEKRKTLIVQWRRKNINKRREKKEEKKRGEDGGNVPNHLMPV